MQQLIEEIKPIKGYEELYSISNYGYIISEAKKWIARRNTIHKKEKTILKSTIGNRGYLHINLCKDGNRKTHENHLLVWDHFGDRSRDGRILQVDHKDEDKLNCRIDNLQLLTARENTVKYHKMQKTSSKFTGVSWNNTANKWTSQIIINGKLKHLGCFTNEIEASNEYQRALKEYNKTGEITRNIKKKTSKFAGVHLCKRDKNWRAQIIINNKQKHIGYFTSEYEAHKAYMEAKRKV